MRSAFRRELLNAVFLTGGIFSAAMGIKGFLVSFVALGLHQMGAAFAARSTVGILGLAAVLAFVPFPDVTPDLVLTAVFGGFFLGAGIGLAIRGGAVLDGTEIAALLISRRGDLLRVGDIILGFNALLFVSAIALLGVEPALYSILTYLAAARTPTSSSTASTSTLRSPSCRITTARSGSESCTRSAAV